MKKAMLPYTLIFLFSFLLLVTLAPNHALTSGDVQNEGTEKVNSIQLSQAEASELEDKAPFGKGVETLQGGLEIFGTASIYRTNMAQGAYGPELRALEERYSYYTENTLTGAGQFNPTYFAAEDYRYTGEGPNDYKTLFRTTDLNGVTQGARELDRLGMTFGDFNRDGKDEIFRSTHTNAAIGSGLIRWEMFSYQGAASRTRVWHADHGLDVRVRDSFLGLDMDADGADELLVFRIAPAINGYQFFLYDWTVPGEATVRDWYNPQIEVLASIGFTDTVGGGTVETADNGNIFRYVNQRTGKYANNDNLNGVYYCSVGEGRCYAATNPPGSNAPYNPDYLITSSYFPNAVSEVYLDNGDFNGDGREDFVLSIFPRGRDHHRTFKYEGKNSAFVSVLEIDRTQPELRKLRSHSTMIGGDPGRPVVADFNQDHADDIFFPYPSEQAHVGTGQSKAFIFTKDWVRYSIGPLFKEEALEHTWIYGVGDLDKDGKQELMGFSDFTMERRELTFVPGNPNPAHVPIPNMYPMGHLRVTERQLYVDQDNPSNGKTLYQDTFDSIPLPADQKTWIKKAQLVTFGTGGGIKYRGDNNWNYQVKRNFVVRFGDLDNDRYPEAVVPSWMGTAVIDFTMTEECSNANNQLFPANKFVQCNYIPTPNVRFMDYFDNIWNFVNTNGDDFDVHRTRTVWAFNDLTWYIDNQVYLADVTGDSIRARYIPGSVKKVSGLVTPIMIMAAAPFVDGFQEAGSSGFSFSTSSGTGSSETVGYSVGASLTVGLVADAEFMGFGEETEGSVSASWDKSFSTEIASSNSVAYSQGFSGAGRHKILFLDTSVIRYAYEVVGSNVKLTNRTMTIDIPNDKVTRFWDLKAFHEQYPEWGFDTILKASGQDSFDKVGDPTKYIRSSQLPSTDSTADRLIYKSSSQTVAVGSGTTSVGIDVSKDYSTTKSSEHTVGIAATLKQTIKAGPVKAYAEVEGRSSKTWGSSTSVSLGSGVSYSGEVGAIPAQYAKNLDYRFGIYVHEVNKALGNTGTSIKVLILDYFVDYDPSTWNVPDTSGQGAAVGAGAVATGVSALTKKKECACK